MREVIQHEPGTFCWPELATTDAESAKALYGALFGWTFDDQSRGGRHDVHDRAARRQGRGRSLRPPELAARELGVAAHWNSYAAVDERRRERARA